MFGYFIVENRQEDHLMEHTQKKEAKKVSEQDEIHKN